MALRAGFHGTVGQPSAQVIDGSLKFDDDNKQFLKKTFSSGNSKTWTWSAWIKRDNFGADHRLFTSDADANNQGGFKFIGDQIQFFSRKSGTFNINLYTAAVLRDTGWYHLMVAVDTTISSPSTDRVKLYVNGALQTIDSSYNTYPSQNYETRINTNIEHLIGRYTTGDSQYMNGAMSQVYFIEGQALGPEYFGFTDPLTNTWRPKKFSGSFTTTSNLDGTVWTSKHSGTVYGGSVANVFDTDLTNRAEINSSDSNNNHFTISSINLLSASSVGVYVSNSGTDVEVLVNDTVVGTISSGSITSSSQLFSFSFTETTVTSIKVRRVGSTSGWYLYGILVNSTQLIDGVNHTGVNSFYLPMDGNSPIGQDKSGNGNDWTPVNFGGSVALDNPQVSGGRPVLNTTQGGSQAGVGVFGSKENKYYTVTTANGSVYQFDITSGDNPSLEFIRGATYKFDYSGHTGHPVLFSSTNPDSSTTAYTDGTSTASNIISFTVPHNAPDTLYYYCQNHPTGMNGSISVTTDETKADPYAWKCILAVPGVGGDYTDKSAQLNCTSTTKASSAGGDPSSDGSCNFYNSSIDLDGNDKVTYTRTNAGDFSGQGDFTIEAWFNTDTTGATDAALFSNWDSGNNRSIIFGPNASGNGKFTFIFNTTGSGGWTTVAGADAVAGKWVHVAWVYDHSATRHYAYINGILQGSATGTAYNNSTANFLLGVNKGDASGYYNGKVQDLRYYHAVKYTASGTTSGEVVFTLPSTSPDILPDTPSGVSGSSKLTKITDGAVAFDGSGDYLSTPHVASTYEWWDTSFTLEYYVYPNAFGAGANSATNMVGKSDPNSNPESWSFGAKADGTVEWYYWVGSIQRLTTTNTISLKKWTHLAFTHDGSNNMKIFIDGKVAASGTISGTPAALSTSLPFNIGKNANAAFNGMISNLRMIRGTALYTSDFTPPTAPLTDVTNTKLLCCQSTTQAGTAAASPNVSGVNDGTVWSDYLTPSDNFTASGKTAGFDGSTSTFSQPGTNSSSLTFAPPGGITYSTSVEVYTYQSNGVFTTVSDGAQSVSWTTLYQGWKTIASGGGTFTSTVLTSGNPSASDSRPTFAAIRVDGTILVDPVLVNGDAAATNFNPFNTDINTVRGQETGYATFNPLIAPSGGDSQGSGGSLSDGNLTIKSGGSTGNYHLASCSPSIPLTGKYYFEFTTISAINTDNNTVGIFNPESPVYASGDYARINPSFSGSFTTTKKRSGTATNLAASAGDFSAGDVVNIAIDSDNRSIWFGRNGVYYEGNPSLGTGASYTNLTSGVEYVVRSFVYTSGGTEAEGRINFGQKPFSFPPPDGFQPLNAANVRPETVITRPDQYFEVATYAGNATTQHIDVGLRPDFVWIKERTDNGGVAHYLGDTVRGINKNLKSNNGDSEGTNNAYGYVSSVDDKGFTVTQGSSDSFYTNGNPETYVAWTWKAGGNKGDFNIDDVGYANASDVNMSVGTLNNAAYNTSQAWSSNASGGNAANAFNGNGPLVNNYSHSGSALTLTFSPALTGRIVVYGGTGAGSHNSTTTDTFTLSDGSVLSSQEKYNVAPYWTEMDFGEKSNISSLTCSAGYTLYAITVDGKLLVDSGVTPSNVPSLAPSGCSVGTRQGFSIITYGMTASSGYESVPHGLTQQPEFGLFKSRDADSGSSAFWGAYYTANGNNTNWLQLDDNVPQGNNSGSAGIPFTSGAFVRFTDKVVQIAHNAYAGAGNSQVGYMWHSVPGLQKFGLVETSSDIGYAELGFRPALVIVKNIDGNASWSIRDNKRGPYNPITTLLRADTSAKDFTSSGQIDFLSNGFKIGGSGFGSYTYFYAAWAEAPSFNLYGGQSNAR